MSAKRPEDMFAERIDKIMFDGEPVTEEDDAELLEFAARLEKAMPQAKASDAFREKLRAELIQQGAAKQQSAPVRRAAEPEKKGFSVWWRRRAVVLGSAMAVLLLAAVGIYTLQNQNQPLSMTASTPAAGTQEQATPTSDVGVAMAPESTPTSEATVASAERVAVFGPIQRVKQITEAPGMGLGGGGAEGPVGPINLPGFSFPAKAISSYDLSVPLPDDMPADASVFKLIRPDNLEVAADAVAERLGFSGKPEIQEIPYGPEAGSPLQPSYLWIDGVRSLSVSPLDGRMIYNDREGLPEPGAGSTPISSEEAAGAARKYLEERGLLQPEFALGDIREIAVQTSDDQSQPATLMGWRVRFAKSLDGAPVDGAYLEVTVTASGDLATIEMRNHEIGESGPYPLRPVTDAWDEVASGGALWVKIPPVPNAIDGVETIATITSVEIGYSEDLHGQNAEYLQPLYIFSGTVTNADGQQYVFKAFATALAGEVLVSE